MYEAYLDSPKCKRLDHRHIQGTKGPVDTHREMCTSRCQGCKKRRSNEKGFSDNAFDILLPNRRFESYLPDYYKVVFFFLSLILKTCHLTESKEQRPSWLQRLGTQLCRPELNCLGLEVSRLMQLVNRLHCFCCLSKLKNWQFEVWRHKLEHSSSCRAENKTK